MDRYKVLPTDQRFYELTDDQINLLYFYYLNQNPDLKRRYENFKNKEFMDMWNKVQKDEDVDMSNIGWDNNLDKQFEEMVKNDPIDNSRLSDFDKEKIKASDKDIPSHKEHDPSNENSSDLGAGDIGSDWEEVD